MNKTIFSLCIAIFSCLVLNAQVTAQGVLNSVISQYNKDKNVSADFLMSSAQGQSNGSIVMSGNKFRLLSSDAKCWYDGTTQWAYSTATDEVNITKPTNEELQMSNPYVAINSFRDYNITLLKSNIASNYLLQLIPKSTGSQIKEIHLSVAKSSYHPVKIIFVLDGNSTYTTIISNYKAGGNYPQSTFVFNKKDVPNGTSVVDLR